MGPLFTEVETVEVETAAPTLEDKVDELLTILRPLAPVIEQAPDALAKVGPFIEKLQSNPLLGGFFR